MEYTNNEVTINETIIVDDKIIDFIALAYLANLKPKRIAGTLNGAGLPCNATDEDYIWDHDKIRDVLKTVTVDRELRVLGLEPDQSPVPWRGFRISGPLPDLTPEEEVDIEVKTAALVTGGLSRVEVDEQIEEAHSEKWSTYLKVLNHHGQTFGQEKITAHIKYLQAEVRKYPPNPYLDNGGTAHG